MPIGWLIGLRLSLNIGKTYALISSKCDYNIILDPIIFDSKFVDIVSEAKFLGVFVDNDLSFRKHISYVCNKLSKTVGILSKIKHFVPLDIMIKLYNSLAYPYFTYCNVVWGNTFPTHVKPIIVLQKKLVRIITNSHYLEHTSPLFKLTNILPYEKLHSYLLALHMFRKLSSNQIRNSTRHDYNTRSGSEIHIPFHRLSISQHSVDYASGHVWNMLPQYLKNCVNMRQFKKLLKNHLMLVT